MKRILHVLLMIAVATTANAQLKHRISRIDPSIRPSAKAIDLNDKTGHKPTAVYWRIAAISGYGFFGGDTTLVDSGKYQYSNARGSAIDFDEPEINDYGLGALLNYDTAYKYADRGAGIEVVARYAATYDNSNRRTRFEEAAKPMSGPLENNLEEKAVYNSNGDITTKTTSTWSVGLGQWLPVSASEYRYDNQKRMTVDSYYSLLPSPMPVNVSYYTYDVNGNLSQMLTLEWNGSSWDSLSRTTHTYYTNNKLQMSVSEIYDTNALVLAWQNTELDTMGYHVNGRINYREYREWDSLAAEWVNTDLETRGYNSNDELVTAIFSTWDDNNSMWETEGDVKLVYNNDANLALIEAYMYINGVRIPVPVFIQNIYYEHYFDVGIEKNPVAGAVTVYPNPAKEYINVQLNSNRSMQIKLTDMSGRIARTVPAEAGIRQITMSTSGLAPGNYILTVEDGASAPARQVITIQ